MIRTALVYLYVLGLSIYAWRRPFVSLCGLVLLVAFVRHPDMPRNVASVQGLNPWNLLLAGTLVAWLQHRRWFGWRWDMPRRGMLLFGCFLAAVFVAFLRLLADPAGWGEDNGIAYVISEYFINNVKWVVPGLLLFDMCRDERTTRIALFVVAALYLFLALQVIQRMPLASAFGGEALSRRASKVLQNDMGYNRVTLSVMLAGASWACVTLLPLVSRLSHRLALLAVAGVIVLGQALTAGRTGYVAWACVGLFLCVVKWRRLLPLVPLAGIAVFALMPGVRERMMMGVGSIRGGVVVHSNTEEMTSGRSLIWPHVIDQIMEGPVIGYGRLAMRRTGLTEWLSTELDEDFGHPHNAYLEVLLDGGVVSFLLVVPLFVWALWRGLRLFLVSDSPVCAAAGGMACAIVSALLVGAMSGMTFYPREGSVAMWAAIGIMLRVSVERSRSLKTGAPLFDPSESDSEATDEICEDSPQPA